MLKDIVVHVDDEELARAPCRVAASLAAGHGSRLTGVHAIAVPRLPPYAEVSIPESVRQSQREMFTEAAEGARGLFESVCAAGGVESQWVCETGSVEKVLAAHALLADLVVVRRSAGPLSGQMPAGLAGDMALGIRRPILVVPPESDVVDLSGPAMFAWKATPESARALADALPILAAASMVTVVSVAADAASGAIKAELDAVCAHMKRHGVSAQARLITGRSDVGKAMLDTASAMDADLIVLGAYGHNRMREMLFGGVTEFMLSHSELPILMSH